LPYEGAFSQLTGAGFSRARRGAMMASTAFCCTKDLPEGGSESGRSSRRGTGGTLLAGYLKGPGSSYGLSVLSFECARSGSSRVEMEPITCLACLTRIVEATSSLLCATTVAELLYIGGFSGTTGTGAIHL
jgi:hypothetical protein